MMMKPIPRTMWVWGVEELILNSAEKETFFYFCGEKGIKEIFLQLPLSYKTPASGKITCRILHQDELRVFLRKANSKGIKVHGLDGHPSFALKKNHPRVFSIVKAVADFNLASRADDKFYGIHFDNEPYLLPGFQVAERRKILLEFLELNKRCDELAHSGKSGLAYGVDIPFWLAESVENIDEETSYVVPFDGENKPTSFHLVDICDNIGIMDYRNFAGGPDGMVAHGLTELEYAEEKGKGVYIGIETSKYPEATITFTYGIDKKEFNKRFLNIEKRLEDSIYYEGFKLRLFNDGFKVHAGLIMRDGAEKAAYEDRLVRLAKELGRNFYGLTKESKDKTFFDLKSLLSHNVEFKGFRRSEWENVAHRQNYSFFEIDEIMLPKISFAGTDEETLENTLSEAGEEFSKYSSFTGFAVHHYKSYQKLCTGIYL